MKFSNFLYFYLICLGYIFTKKIKATLVEFLDMKSISSEDSDNFETNSTDVIIYDKNSTYVRFFTVSSCANSCGKTFTDCSCDQDCEVQRTCCYDYNRCTQVASQIVSDKKNSCKIAKLDLNECLQCREKYYLNINECVQKCPEGTEPVEQNKICRPKKCPQEKCDKCRDNVCRKCYPGSFLFEGKCLDVCPLKFRADRKSWTCKRRTDLSFYSVVPSNYDCTNQCGTSNNPDCSCDYTCLQKGNCCENFMSKCRVESLKENCLLCDYCDDKGICLKCKKHSTMLDGQCVCKSNYTHNVIDDSCVSKSELSAKIETNSTKNCTLCDNCDDKGRCSKCVINATLTDGQCKCNPNYAFNSIDNICTLTSELPSKNSNSTQAEVKSGFVLGYTSKPASFNKNNLTSTSLLNSILNTNGNQVIKSNFSKQLNETNFAIIINTTQANQTKEVFVKDSKLNQYNNTIIANSTNVMELKKITLSDTKKVGDEKIKNNFELNLLINEQTNKTEDKTNLSKGINITVTKSNGINTTNVTKDLSKKSDVISCVNVPKPTKIKKFVNQTAAISTASSAPAIIYPIGVPRDNTASIQTISPVKIDQGVEGIVDFKPSPTDNSDDFYETIKTKKYGKNNIRNLNIFIGNSNVQVLNKHLDN